MDDQNDNPFRRGKRAGRPKQGPGKPTPERRPGLRQLPPDFDDLATGRIERLRRPRPARNPVVDEREGAVIPGVRNSDARAVYDARVAALRAALDAGREAELEAGLLEVLRLALWRARNVTDFRAFAESIVGIGPELTSRIVDAAAQLAPFPPHAVALSIRVQAALLARLPQARAGISEDTGRLALQLDVPLADVPLAIEALSDAGRTAVGLRRFLRGEQSTDEASGNRDRDGYRDRGRYDDAGRSDRFSGRESQGSRAGWKQRRDRSDDPGRRERDRSDDPGRRERSPARDSQDSRSNRFQARDKGPRRFNRGRR